MGEQKSKGTSLQTKPTPESQPLPLPGEKRIYVRQMFGRIARRYDLMNHLMTFGRDRVWRRHTAGEVLPALPDPSSTGMVHRGRILDMATGTGDLAYEMLRQRPTTQVVGLDFVPEMLLLARQKAKNPVPGPALPAWVTGDALETPFPKGTFDAVITAFALRNVTDIPATFAEMARVTRPGGRIACLEIAKPRLPLFQRLFALYFYRLVPRLGGWITGERAAYTYLPHSLTDFLTPEEIAQVMRRTGWHDVHYRRLMLGTVAVHVGVRTA
ncbi:MAG: ubiquinone/menaquinone biosynthesis methyltransferase [Anaerolineae bacterium]|jgi:demethylmenaquinone methyltransferase/2-methoxy-6-polyprenyl-1,4-benzoquinol methylase